MLCFAWGREFSSSTHVVSKWASCKELSLSLLSVVPKREKDYTLYSPPKSRYEKGWCRMEHGSHELSATKQNKRKG